MKDRFNTLKRAGAVGAFGIGGLATLTACGIDEATYEDIYVRATCPEGTELAIPAFANRPVNIGTGSVLLQCLDADGTKAETLGVELMPDQEGANVEIEISYHDGFFDDGAPSISADRGRVSFYGSANIEHALVLTEEMDNTNG